MFTASWASLLAEKIEQLSWANDTSEKPRTPSDRFRVAKLQFQYIKLLLSRFYVDG
jgi:hypothetical protein